MIVIRSPADISNARLPSPIAAHLDKLFVSILRSVPDFNPENDGHLILITPSDTDAELCSKIGRRWADSCFEGVRYDQRCYHAVILHNNQFTVSIIVPDEPWLDPVIRERMIREIS